MVKEIDWRQKLIALKGPLTDHDKVDILLIYASFKPTAIITELACFRSDPASRKQFLEVVRSLKQILKGLKLEYALSLNYPKDSNQLTAPSFIARNKKTLALLMRAHKIKNTKQRRLRVGTLLGYPMTAVIAFANGEIMENSTLPAMFRRKPEMKFLNFKLSRNFKKEFGYLSKEACVIKKIAPKLYKRIVIK